MIASKILGFSKVVHSENDFWNMIRCQPSRGISLNLYHRRCNASDIGVLGIQLPLEGRLDKDRLGATSRVLPAVGSSPSCRHAPGAFIALVSTLPQELMNSLTLYNSLYLSHFRIVMMTWLVFYGGVLLFMRLR